jgi:putative tricarboxylic transport membrane protein
MDYAFWTAAGIVYGFVMGLIPVAGATTALITLFPFVDMFRADPYLLVCFTTAIVVASTIGDSFASVVLNIPGASGSAATMVDGFPLAQQGQGGRALSAAITTSVVNGAVWGVLVFAFLPVYASWVLNFGIPEMLMFLLLAFCSVVFVNSAYWARGIVALALGVFVGLIGQDPITGAARFTGGWDYLAAGVQLVPIMAGILAFPELIEAYRRGRVQVAAAAGNWSQILQGMRDSWRHRWDGLRGGFVGALVGIVPGIGGNIADWLAYGQTVAANPRESVPFGQGNIKGVIGAEGANNAQKATSYVPTVLFGVPGAPFEVIILALFMMVGLELGTPTLLSDTQFFTAIGASYAAALAVTFVLAMLFVRWAQQAINWPFAWYFWPVMAILIWTSAQYTGYWEDYAVFAICCAAGLAMRNLKLSRAAFIIGFALSDQLEKIWYQYHMLYSTWDFATRPIALTLCVLAIAVTVWGLFFNRSRISYV